MKGTEPEERVLELESILQGMRADNAELRAENDDLRAEVGALRLEMERMSKKCRPALGGPRATRGIHWAQPV